MKSFKYIWCGFLLVFTIMLGINQYDAAIYADTHGTNGDSVRWFGKFGMGVFLISSLLFIISLIFISFSHGKHLKNAQSENT